MDNESRFRLTRSDVCKRLALSPERVRQLAVSGRLPTLQTPLGRLYDANAVEALALSRRANAERTSHDG